MDFHKWAAQGRINVAEPDSVNISQPANSNAKSCYLCVGHSRPGALQDHHHCLLPRGHGLHPNVRHHQRGVLRCCAGLVSGFGLSGVNIGLFLTISVCRCHLLSHLSVDYIILL